MAYGPFNVGGSAVDTALSTTSQNPISNAAATAAINGKENSGAAAKLANRTTAANAADTNYTTYMFRGESLNSAETTPTVNGTIAWTYE